MDSNRRIWLVVILVVLVVIAVVAWIHVGRGIAGGGSYESQRPEDIPQPVEGKAQPVPPTPQVGTMGAGGK
jgi:hypothetical protein